MDQALKSELVVVQSIDSEFSSHGAKKIIEAKLIYYILLVSGVHHRDLVIYMY